MRFAWRLTAVWLLAATPAGGQIVRGTVVDARTRAPIPGVVVSLDEAVERIDTDASLRRASLVLAVLTNERGEYAVQAGFAGRFVVSAKRVGLKRFQSPAFALDVGASRRVDITLEPIDFTAALPTIAVTTDAPCAINPRENQRVADLWDEARTALTSTRLALRDRMFQATLTRYTRQLSPTALRVLSEETSIRRGATERPYYSLDAGRLSAAGYMQPDAEGGQVYYAPDAAVLTSPEFLRDHCFALAPKSAERRGMIGLAFEPVPARTLPEIRGVFWMDSATHALRLVEFRYTSVSNAPRESARGEVRFSLLASGAWYVSRWFIRMPVFGYQPSAGVPGGSRLAIVRHKEDGGEVVVEGARSTLREASLTGRAMDSTGNTPLRGATVRLSGTRHTAITRADGYFRLDSLPGGAYTLLLDHPDYANLGFFAAEQELEVEEGSSSVTALKALSSEQVFRRLCDRSEPGVDRAAARVLVLDDQGGPRPGVKVVSMYDTFEPPLARDAVIRVVPRRVEIETDGRGAANFCDIPARQPVRFELASGRRGDAWYSVLTARPGSVTIVTLRP